MGEVKEISFEESIGHHKECTHVAHAMYYAFDDGVIWDEFYKKAWIMVSCINVILKIKWCVICKQAHLRNGLELSGQDV